MFEPDHVTSTDIRFGSSVLWRSDCHRTGATHVLPDLSRDLLWLPGELPTVLNRTSVPFLARVEQGQTAIGIRFSPMVTTIEIDSGWPGWRAAKPDATSRTSHIAKALQQGALHYVSDKRLEAVVRYLDNPDIRISDVADRLGISDRQLRRWTTTAIELTPKQLQRHLRLQRYISHKPTDSVAVRALNTGFYDQAHAANEIRALTGLTITELATFEAAAETTIASTAI